MTDIVLRLRANAQALARFQMSALLTEAAQYIEQLESERNQANDAYVALREFFKVKDTQC